MKHRVSIEVDYDDVDERNFQIWVARMAGRWQADVLHETEGEIVQQFEKGQSSEAGDQPSLQQWVIDEYSKINQELVDGWQEVGDLLATRDLGVNAESEISNTA